MRFQLIQYRASAKSKRLPFALDAAPFRDMVTDNCFYCGGLPKPLNGIDRVDNTRGYTEDNTVTACRICNYAKRNMTASDFSMWAERLTARFPVWSEVFV